MYYKISSETSFVKMKHIYVGIKQIFFKSWCKTNNFFVKFSWFKKIKFFFQGGSWSDKLPFETSSFEIGWEFSEIFYFEYLLGSFAQNCFFIMIRKLLILHGTFAHIHRVSFLCNVNDHVTERGQCYSTADGCSLR